MQDQSSSPHAPPGRGWVWFLFTIGLALTVGFVADVASREIIRLRGQQREQRVRQQLQDAVERQEPITDPGYAAHLLLTRIWKNAERAPQSQVIARLEAGLALFHREFPNRFRIIAWDSQGQVIKSLSGQQPFRALIQQGYALFRHLTPGLATSPGDIVSRQGNLDSVAQRLQPVLGRLLSLRPLSRMAENPAETRPILVDPDPDRQYLWFRMGTACSLLAVLDRAVVERPRLLLRKLQALNRRTGSIRFGLADGPGAVWFCGTRSPRWRSFIQHGLFQLAASGEEYLQDGNLSIFARHLPSGLILFAWMPKAGGDTDSDKMQEQFRRHLLALLLPLLFFHLAAGMVGPLRRVPLRYELAALFMIAHLLPMGVLAWQGMAFLEYQRLLSINEIHHRLEEDIRAYDRGQIRFRSKLEQGWRQTLDLLSHGASSSPPAEYPTAAFREACRVLEPSFAYLIASSGKIVWEAGPSPHSGRAPCSVALVTTFARSFLQFIKAPLVPEADAIVPDNWELTVRGALSFARTLALTHLAGEEAWTFWAPAGSSGNFLPDFVLIAGYSASRLDHLFLESTKEQRLCTADGRLFVKTQETSPTRSATSPLPPFQHVSGFQPVQWENLAWEGKTWLGVGMKGRFARTVEYLAISPAAAASEPLDSIKLTLAALAALSFFLMAVLNLGFADKILNPVQELVRGFEALRIGNFSYRVPPLPANELGRIGGQINQILENTAELELAHLVQQSLLPTQPYRIGPFHITGKSRPLLQLGGDYHDVLPLDESRCGVVIGDVAGHGARAGLIMAMAKASFLITARESDEPERFLEGFHKTLRQLQSSSLRTMMTASFARIDSISGEILLSQAGHLPPLRFDSHGESAVFLWGKSTPLGGKRFFHLQTDRFILEPGERLLFYSDGILEAKDTTGRLFGDERLRALILSEASRPADQILERIFAEVSRWSPTPSDDITAVIVSRDGMSLESSHLCGRKNP